MMTNKVIPMLARKHLYEEFLKRIGSCLSLNPAIRIVLDVVIVLLLTGLLYYGASWQMFRPDGDGDAIRYQCYAIAFWQGWSGFDNLPSGQCKFLMDSDQSLMDSQQDLLSLMRQYRLPSGLIQFVAAQSPAQPYHALPAEYPLSALLPFSLGLIAPAHWYRVGFAIGMLVLAACVYFILQRWRSRGAALAYAFYLLVGGWSTVAARFDLMPASLTLFAVICAECKRWNWAFAFLGLATVLKLYPVTLLVPFVLSLQLAIPGKWYVWGKWLPIGIFMGICLLITILSLLLSVVGTLGPLGYFIYRPVELESVWASLLWLFSLLGKTSLTYIDSFGSLNVLSPLSSDIASRMTVLLVVGLLYTWWLQWRNRIDLDMACLLTLLIVIATGKIFSPQYLIWVIPLAAYVEQRKRRWWVLFWILTGLLTSWIFPYIFFQMHHSLNQMYNVLFYPITMIRNSLLIGFIIVIFIYWKRKNEEIYC